MLIIIFLIRKTVHSQECTVLGSPFTNELLSTIDISYVWRGEWGLIIRSYNIPLIIIWCNYERIVVEK